MAKSRRNDSLGEDDSFEDSEIYDSSRRKRKRVNYNEDEYLNDIDDDDANVDDPDEEVKAEHEEAESDYENSKTRPTRAARSKSKVQDDDEYNEYQEEGSEFEDEDEDEEELDSDSSLQYKRRSANNMGNFVIKDDDGLDDDEEEYSISRSKVRRSRSKSKSKSKHGGRKRTRNVVKDEDDSTEDSDAGTTRDSGDEKVNGNDEALSLEQELQELQDSSPATSPVARHLRERKQIDYTIPPPITNDNQLEASNMNDSHPSTPSRRNGAGRGRYTNFFPGTGLSGGYSAGGSFNQPIRRLFPTVGPFGGGDVHSIFQQGANHANNLTALGNADDSSDSDDEELFRPTDPNDTSSKIITANTLNPGNPLQKKKNTLADTDPLGIDTNIDFSAIGGLDNYINQLKEMITLPLLYPEIYSQFHITPPRGVLFHGPPGTGKTLMARALAASCSSEGQKITFFMRKGADCLSKWVGEAERHLRLLFEEAKQQQPAIIFFDEIDGLAPVRSSKQEQIHASIVSTLLALMDGMDNRGQVIVIGATNRPDSIDPALRRPGRFDREFYFPLPDISAREDILKIQMRKWKNKPEDEFIKELARLTKGYGGADLRALCTESALNSIQRCFPQIYKSNDKLKININKVQVQASDFMRAFNKIIPSSARSTSTQSSPLPETIKPLLERNLQNIIEKLDLLVPKEKQPSILEESEYLDVNALINPKDGGFKHYQLLSRLNATRCYRPRLMISGNMGSGQNYISRAVLHHLESFHIQVLDFSKIYNETSTTPEATLIQVFSELKRHKPSVLYIPDAVNFIANVSGSFKSTLLGLIRSIDSNDRILLMAMIEDSELFHEDETTKSEIMSILDMDYSLDSVQLIQPTSEERSKFFQNVWQAIELNPFEFNDLSVRPKRKLKELPVIKTEAAISKENDTANGSSKEQAKKDKEAARHDMSLKNTLKIRLSALMDAFKVRYKRFKKPAIDDAYLVHLFEAEPNPEALYQRDEHDDMIVDTSTGKKYYNIDLDVIEERLWNGFYSEPQQFLKDIEMILKDAKTIGERERLLKANEMYANAQVGVEEIEMTFPTLVEQWKDIRRREKLKERQYLKELEENKHQGNLLTDQATLEDRMEVDDEEDKIDVQKAESTLDNEILEQGQQQAQSQVQLGNIEEISKEEPVLPVVPVAVANGDSDKHIETQPNTEVDADDEEESEQEEIEIPEIPHLVLDRDLLETIKETLILVTEDKSVETLERIDAKLIETIWKHRLEIDKASLLEELVNYLKTI